MKLLSIVTTNGDEHLIRTIVFSWFLFSAASMTLCYCLFARKDIDYEAGE